LALDVSLLRGSFETVLARQPDLTHVFYEELFSRHPEARGMFSPERMGQQEQMLAEALVAVMDHLEEPTWLSSNLPELGAKHMDLGVTEEMYGWVGESLLATLAKVAGDDWTPALQSAWTEAYGAVSGLMLEGHSVAQGA